VWSPSHDALDQCYLHMLLDMNEKKLVQNDEMWILTKELQLTIIQSFYVLWAYHLNDVFTTGHSSLAVRVLLAWSQTDRCFTLFILFHDVVLLFRVWSLKTGDLLNTLIHHCEAVLHLRFNDGIMVTCSKVNHLTSTMNCTLKYGYWQ